MMSHFSYKNGELYCEKVRVSRIIKETGTPCYIYSYQAFVDQYRKIASAFAPVKPLVCFALKSNSNLSVIRLLARQEVGFDIVSAGELRKALKAGADPRTIVFASVGKTEEEIRAALKAGILFFNVESLAELAEIDRLAGTMGKTAEVALRINPDVAASTHDKIVTGTLRKKFGIDLATAGEIMTHPERFPNVRMTGVHMHIGSQITTVEPYVTAIAAVTAFVSEMARHGVALKYFNMGGGFGIQYHHDQPVDEISVFADALVPLLKKTGLRIIMEPGRFISGNSGIFVTRTLYLKDNGVKKFIIVDAGMNDLARPSLYDAHHEIVPVTPRSGESVEVDVVGPICESGDVFAKHRLMPVVESGDLLAIMSAGAYGHVMASNYNVRGRAPEVLVKGARYEIVRRREMFNDLIRGERIADCVR